jgi:hypothetical protein
VSHIKDAYEAGRNAVNQNRKPQQLITIFTTAGVGLIVIFAPYVIHGVWYEIIAIAAWLFLATVFGVWWAKRSSR